MPDESEMDKKPEVRTIKQGKYTIRIPLNQAPQRKGEPHYAEDDPVSQPKIPKWTIPAKGSLQEQILNAVGRRTYQVKSRFATEDEAVDIARAEKKTLDDIAANCAPVEERSSIYPREWVTHCIEVCYSLRRDGKPMNLKGLISFIKNINKMQQWLLYHNLVTGARVKRANYIEPEDKDFL